jgi:uncharacterized delta-60 repeat protein
MSARPVASVIACASALVLCLGSPALADPGDVDSGFGVLGHATVDLLGDDRVGGIDRQSTGKIIVAGDNNATSVQVLRLSAQGETDAGFGAGGSRIIEIPGTTSMTVSDLAIQPNDRILVAGWMNATSGSDRFVVVRFRAGGAPDASFGNGGIRFVGFTQGDAYSYGVSVQSNGRIVVVGEVDPSGPAADSKAAAVRLRNDGTLDTSFGTAGRKVLPIPDPHVGFDGAWRVRSMGDGRLVLAGWNELAAGYRTFAMRLHPDGRLDRSFGGDGIATVNVRLSDDDWAYGLDLADGNIVLGVAGASGEAVVVRLRPGGGRDQTFSGDGIATFAIPSFSVEDIAVQANGRILVSDSTGGLLLRVRPGGAKDLGFGVSGVTEDPAGPARGIAIELQAGKILLAGPAGGATLVSRFLGS